jgi:hypothetical protein
MNEGERKLANCVKEGESKGANSVKEGEQAAAPSLLSAAVFVVFQPLLALHY